MNMRKHIKTFESFYHEDDMVREIAGFLDCSIERIQLDAIYKDTSMFRGYSIDGRVDDEALEALRAYMENEHGLIMATTWNIGVLDGNVEKRSHVASLKMVNLLDKIFLTEKPLKETCIDWLNTNYSGMEAVDSMEYPGDVLYRYVPKDNILFYEKKNQRVWVRYDLIWSFFGKYLGLDDQEIMGITEEWLSETYNLKGITTQDMELSNLDLTE
jgi:hypothetical protein